MSNASAVTCDLRPIIILYTGTVTMYMYTDVPARTTLFSEI